MNERNLNIRSVSPFQSLDKRKHKRGIFSKGRCQSRLYKDRGHNKKGNELPRILQSPQERATPILSPKRGEVNYLEELQKGSEMLRKEAANNLQKFGGNFMFDFYGGKARMDFSTRNEVEQTHQEVANTFVGEKKNKWGVLCNYITSKQNNSDIVTNVITERINDKVKSLEDVKISIKKNCKKKHKFSKMFKNNPNLNAADAMKTYDFANRSRCFSDPRIDNNVENTNFVPNNGTISPLSDNRGVTLKSPLGMKTIGPTEEKSFLKPMPKLRKKKSKKVVDGKEEDFDTYYQKMILPKPLRKVNPNLLKLLPRTTTSDGHSPGLGDLETNIKPTENQKEFIRIKWELKRVETMQKTQMNQFKKLKRKLSPRKVYISEK